jgi:hypothetical protein
MLEWESSLGSKFKKLLWKLLKTTKIKRSVGEPAEGSLLIYFFLPKKQKKNKKISTFIFMF